MESPKLFGWQHITYMVISFIITAVILILLKKKVKDEKKQDLIIKICGIIIIFLLMINRLLIRIYFDKPFMPQSWCAFIELILGISCIFFKRNHAVFEYVAPVSVLSGLLPTILADYLGEGAFFDCYTIFFPTCITSLINHSFILFLGLLLYIFKYYEMDVKRWYVFPLGYAICMLYGVLYMHFIPEGFVDRFGRDMNIMNMNKPIIGSFDAAFIFMLAFPVNLCLLLITDLIKNKDNSVLKKLFKKKA